MTMGPCCNISFIRKTHLTSSYDRQDDQFFAMSPRQPGELMFHNCPEDLKVEIEGILVEETAACSEPPTLWRRTENGQKAISRALR